MVDVDPKVFVELKKFLIEEAGIVYRTSNTNSTNRMALVPAQGNVSNQIANDIILNIPCDVDTDLKMMKFIIYRLLKNTENLHLLGGFDVRKDVYVMQYEYQSKFKKKTTTPLLVKFERCEHMNNIYVTLKFKYKSYEIIIDNDRYKNIKDRGIIEKMVLEVMTAFINIFVTKAFNRLASGKSLLTSESSSFSSSGAATPSGIYLG